MKTRIITFGEKTVAGRIYTKDEVIIKDNPMFVIFGTTKSDATINLEDIVGRATITVDDIGIDAEIEYLYTDRRHLFDYFCDAGLVNKEIVYPVGVGEMRDNNEVVNYLLLYLQHPRTI